MQDADLTDRIKYLIKKLHYKSFTIWQIITLVQICMIFGLVGTIAYKGYTNRKVNKEVEGEVAGIAAEQYSIPNEVTITVEEVSKSFDPIDFNFRFVDVRDANKENKIIKAVRSFIKKQEEKDIIYDKYLEFDETKFTYWLKANFGTLEEEVPLKPKLTLYENSTQISECVPGYSTRKIPIQSIMDDLKTFKQIPEDLYFVVDVGQLAADEQMINDTCNSINLFKRNLRKVIIKTDTQVAQTNDNKKETFKTYDFLTDDEVNRIFAFNLIKEELVIKIAKKDYLRQSIERVKRIFDQKPDTKQIRIGDKLVLVGEEKEIVIINTDESIRVAENLLTRGENMENFPIVIEKNDGIYNNEQVFKFPKRISYSEVKIPTIHQKDAIRMSQLLDLYDNIILDPGETFSFANQVGQSKLSPLISDEKPLQFNTPDEKVEYYKSLEPISTLFFRLGLDSGLPFTERYINVLNKDISHFGYPVSEMPLVNITGKAIKTEGDGTNKERTVDLKFVNPSGQQIIILTDYEFQENNEIILKAEMYTTNQFNSVNSELKDFQKDTFDLNGIYKGYFIVFTRMVNDKPEVYSIYFYDQQQ